MEKKVLKLSLAVIKRRFLNNDSVKEIAIDAGCAKSTIYRLMEDNGITCFRRRKITSMVYSIKPLPQYKNGKLI